MSKLVLFVYILVGINIAAFSQDVIVTKDSRKINAKVLEINSDNVRYKHFNNLEGPIYTLLKSEIATIVYQNGMIDVFGEKEKEKEEVKPIFEDDNLFVPRIGGIGQSKMENEFYAIGTDDNKMLNYLRKYDASSHEKFVAACNQRSKGKSLFGQGMALTGLGAIVFIGFVNMEEDPTAHTNRKLILLATGTVIMAVGEVFIIVSIPISASAGAKKKAIKEDFEQQYFSNKKYSYQPKLNFGITQGGLGFTLNF